MKTSSLKMLLFTFMFNLCLFTPVGAIEDIAPPDASNMSLSTSSVNTESSEVEIFLNVTLTDNMSGVCIAGDCGSYTSSPSQLRMKAQDSEHTVTFYNFTRTSGNEQNGTYSARVLLPIGIKNGTWTVESFYLVDWLGNSTTIYPDLSFVNTAEHWDNTAPQLTDLSITPEEINTENNEVELTMTMTVTDNQAGVCISSDCGSFYISSPTQLAIAPAEGNQKVYFSVLTRTSGDKMNGIYTARALLPKGAKNGIWHVENILLVDWLGNIGSGQSDITINNTAPFSDNTPPTVSDFSITPTQVNTSTAEAELILDISLSDESNVCISADCGAFYTSSPTQLKLVPLIGTQNAIFFNLTRMSGDEKNGVYRSRLVLPPHSKEGIWTVDSLLVVDWLGNHRTISANELNNSFGSNSLTIVNTAEAETVTIEKEWVITGSKTTVSFPTGTVVTKKDGGNFAFYQMANQEFSIETLQNLPNENLTGEPVILLRLGIPGLNLSFSKDVTIALSVGEGYENKILTIQSLSEGESSWSVEESCKVTNGQCSFSVNHATYFIARTTILPETGSEN